MVSKKLIAFAGVAAATIGGSWWARRRWQATPDPLGGKTPVFTADDTISVPTDDGAMLRVVRAGDGPTVVLVHGLTSAADDWGPIADRLVALGFRVIGVNQRGHGGSTLGSDEFSAERLGKDLRQVLAALDLTDITLVGHSMGGIAAMTFAVDHDQAFTKRVRGLGLVATTANTSDLLNRFGLTVVSGRPGADIGGDSDAANGIKRHLARHVFGDKPSWALLGYAVASAERCPDETRIAAARGLKTYNIEDRIDQIAAPTVVICGTRDLLTSFGENEQLADTIPAAKFVAVHGAGHVIIWEEPDVVAAEIADLASVTQPVG